MFPYDNLSSNRCGKNSNYVLTDSLSLKEELFVESDGIHALICRGLQLMGLFHLILE